MLKRPDLLEINSQQYIVPICPLLPTGPSISPVAGLHFYKYTSQDGRTYIQDLYNLEFIVWKTKIYLRGGRNI